jgi:sec-independent protein translocase protein TatA
MPFNLGTPELIIILVIVIVLFGAGRISKIAGELGSGIRAFRKGLSGPDEGTPKKEN